MKYKIVEISRSELLTKGYSEHARLHDIYGENLRIYTILDKNNGTIGSFILYIFNKLWEKHIITPPFLTDIQLRINCKAQNPSQVNSFYKDILESIALFLREQQATVVDIVLPPYVLNGLPFVWAKFDLGIRYTYLLDLSFSEMELLNRMSSQRRKNIKDGEKSEVVVDKIDDTEIIKKLALETLSSKNAKYSEDLVNRIVSQSSSERLFTYLVHDNTDKLAMATCLSVEDEVYYLFGWVNSNAENSNAGTLALWNCIKHSQSVAKRFNFAGSKIPSVERYFRGFGGELTPCLSISRKKGVSNLFKK
ncbi:MAG: hypothetical protein H6599_10450 [Flavobacteriales bacterium]|nr:hypothetical protein [Flavobacteriales bacterium]